MRVYRFAQPSIFVIVNRFMEVHLIITAVFLGALFVQVIFWMSFMRFSFSRQRRGPFKAQPVSILVCAWNERKNLEELLPLLLQQNHPEFEVIVLDDRSVDDTYEYLVELRKQYQDDTDVSVQSDQWQRNMFNRRKKKAG